MLFVGTIFAIVMAAQVVGQTIRDNILSILMGKFKPKAKLEPEPESKSEPESKTDPSSGQYIKQEQPITPIDPKRPKYDQPIQINSNYYRILNSDVNGNVIGTKTDIVEDGCRTFCDSLFNCRMYSYNPTNGQCKIHSVKKTPGIDSGMKRSDGTFMINIGKTIAGDTIYNGVKQTPYMSACEDMCKADKDCHWYNFELANKKCTLKKSNFIKGNILGIKPGSSGS